MNNSLLQLIEPESYQHAIAQQSEAMEAIPVAEYPTDFDRGWWDGFCQVWRKEPGNFDYMTGYYEGQLDSPNSACYNPNRQLASHQEGQPTEGFIEF